MSRPGDRFKWTVTVVLALLALLTFPVAAAIGTATQTRLEFAALDQKANGPHTTAVLLEDVPETSTDPSGLVQTQPAARATWTLPDGSSRTGLINAEAGAKAGQHVPLWLYQSGAPTRPPMRPGDITLSAVLTAVFILLVAEFALGLTYTLMRALLNRSRLAHWEAEWAQVEPTWRQRGY